MALPKKGFRKITVDGEQFLWKVRKKINNTESHNSPLGIPIQHHLGGQLLIALIAFSRSGYGEYTLTEITPALIKKCINKAIKSGWRFKEQGPVMEVDCRELS